MLCITGKLKEEDDITGRGRKNWKTKHYDPIALDSVPHSGYPVHFNLGIEKNTCAKTYNHCTLEFFIQS